ncbi:MAG TPA: RagB/SusD family nutrient uptake outer membrane protein [Hanamia sp.]|nr:RagB/SusD family nutrient uptake outer membrane protein [Hanamia sp.]
MKKQSIYILLGVFLISSFSCTKDLKLTPTSLISANSFWKNSDDAEGGLYGMYVAFRNLAQSNLYLLGEARSEIMGNGIQNADFRIKYFTNTLTATNADLNWSVPYQIIDYANLIIKNVPGIPFADQSLKNSILAQAYAMRAYIYFTLAKTWGDVPLITDPTSGFDATSTFKERTPVGQVFDLIKTDIDQALKLFPDNKFPVGRSTWSKPATYVLKGDVYLWTGKLMSGGQVDFKTALNALDSAQTPDVGLLPNYSDIFSYTNKGNKEIIFAAHFQYLESTNNYFGDMWIAPGDIPPTIDSATASILGIGGNYNWWAPTALVRNQFTDDDQRKAASFLDIYSHVNGVSKYFTSVVLKGQGYILNGVRLFLNDVIIYRYAEVLLLKAEAENALGLDPSAEINAVRQRAYGNNFPAHIFVSGSQAENDDAILKERLLELAFEGKRWWDLVRFGKAFDIVPTLQGRQGSQYLLLWPVTQETITLNPKIQQTPGY